ncbi:MAG: hypothetical protein GVY19_05270 [Bacteroidetes bacterium]|jgi:hypothetical protein|nr:hypothetical protein [Bacteroidota bacterium]
MKKKVLHIIFTTSLILLVTSTLTAQEARERLMAERIAFFTEKLQLTSEEAQQFWPVYNEYKRHIHDINRERRQQIKYFSNNADKLSDRQVQEILDKQLELHKKEVETISYYQEKFLAFLPPQKVMKIYITEQEFKSYLLKQLRENRSNRTPQIRQ